MTKYTASIFALDLATVTGWAYGRPDGPPAFGHARFGKKGGERNNIYRSFRIFLEGWQKHHKLNLIIYESPASPMIMQGRTNIGTIKLLIGLGEHLEEWCLGTGIDLREASVSQVRAHFIGSNMKSKLAKAATIARCHELGWMVRNDNEADACALWSYQVCCLRPDIAVGMTPLFIKERA